MSDVVSVRIPRELREKMRKYRVDWSREVRQFIEERIRVLKFLGALEAIEKKTARRKTRVDSVMLIREERERH